MLYGPDRRERTAIISLDLMIAAHRG